MSKLEDRIGEPYYKLADKKMLPNVKEWVRIPKYCILSRMLMPAFYRTFEVTAKNQAYINVCKTGLALKIYKGKYGYYPDSLDKLKPEFLPEIPLDPFTGKSLIYRKTANSVLVYSVGENLKDDGGQWGKAGLEGGGRWDTGDIVWEE
jgi:hypothetical protein